MLNSIFRCWAVAALAAAVARAAFAEPLDKSRSQGRPVRVAAIAIGQAAEDAKQDRVVIAFEGFTPNKMVCDTTLRELPDGSWILFMLAGGDTEPSPKNYTGVTRSLDRGKTWSPLERFDVGFPRQGSTIGQGPSELMVLGGRCTLFFSTHGKHWDTQWRSWFLTSDDSFKTWSKPQEVPGRLKYRTFVRNHIVTRDGRIMVPWQHYIGPEAEQSKPPLERAFANPRNGVLISTDGGKTWSEHGNIRLTPNDRYFGWAENNLAELGDGRIAMIVRADGLGGVLYYAESHDGGKTWPEFATKTSVPNPGSKATLYGLGGDAVAMLHNPNPKHRSPLALWISFDGMKTWPYRRVLVPQSCDGPKGNLNYPDGFVSRDRQWLHFAFDDNRHRAVVYSAKLPSVLARVIAAPPKGQQVWPSQPPKDCPLPPSGQLAGIFFTGRDSDYHCGDTWYPSWASDGNQYSPWTDGVTEGVTSNSGGEKAVTGNAVMIGDDPLRLRIHNTTPPQPASPRPYEGRYPCGSLVHNGIWYYGTYCLGPAASVVHEGFTYNWPVLGPMPGFRISKDFGKTWSPSPLSPSKPLFPEPHKFMGPVKMGCPHFVDFGRNMEHSPDGKAYLVGMGAEENDLKPRYANLSWVSADQVYLARVTPSIESINDPAQYEFYAGQDASGKPCWTRDFSRIKPLVDWNNNMGCVTVTYNAPLKKYLMCVTDGWPTVAKMNSYILEADALTGPWRLVVYMKDFGEQGYFLNFPSKFISNDGRTLWLCYSANFSPGWNNVQLKFNPPGGRYGLCLHEVRLLGPGEKTAAIPNPLEGPDNVAPQAKVEASSTYLGYSAQGAIDRNVGGFPGAVGEEWASKAQAKGAWLKLTWDRAQSIRRIWLFDRPNALDQVLGGTLEFSDGTSIALDTPLPDSALQGIEIEFPPKTVTWLKFTVTEVKPASPNIGLAEIAVFR